MYKISIDFSHIRKDLLRTVALDHGEFIVSACFRDSNLTRDLVNVFFHRLFRLTALDVGNCRLIQSTDFGAIASGCYRTLTSLDISDNSHLTDESLLALTGEIGVCAPSCTKIKSLHLRKCVRVSDYGLCAVARNCRSLTHLDLEGVCLLTDTSLLLLSQNCVQLRVLILTNCAQITNRGLQFIGDNLIKLSKLSVSNCSLISDTGLKNLTSSLKDNRFRYSCLRHVDVSGCMRITELGLCYLLEQLRDIEYANLEGCTNIYPSGMTQVLKGLPYLEISPLFYGFTAKTDSKECRLLSLTVNCLNRMSKVICRFFRVLLSKSASRKKALTLLKTQKSVKIEACWRRFNCRKRYLAYLKYNQVKNSALIVLRFFRNVLRKVKAKRILLYLRRLSRHCPQFVRSQALIRGYLVRKKIRDKFSSMKARATFVKLQPAISSLQHRFLKQANDKNNIVLERELQDLNKTIYAYAVKIQHRFRSFLATRRLSKCRLAYDAKKRVLNKKTLRIQRVYRRFVRRRLLRRLILAKEACEVRIFMKLRTIQCFYRCVLARNDFAAKKRENQFKLSCIVKVQSIFRKFKVPSWKKQLLEVAKEKQYLNSNKEFINSSRAIERRMKLGSPLLRFLSADEELEDWQEYFDERSQECLYFSPSRSEISLTPKRAHEFEKSLVNCEIKLRFKNEAEFHAGRISSFNTLSKLHRLDFNKLNVGSLWIQLSEERENVYINYSGDESSIKGWQTFSQLLSQHEHIKIERKKYESRKLFDILNSPTPETTNSTSLWHKYSDPESGALYYYNPVSGESVWETL